MKPFVVIVSFLFLIFWQSTSIAFDVKSHLSAEYNTAQKLPDVEPVHGDEPSIYWHQVPTWPESETRRTDDPQFSANRGGLISYTTLVPGQIMFGVIPAISAEHLKTGEMKMRLIVNFASFYQDHQEGIYALKVDGEVTEVSLLTEKQLTEWLQFGMLNRSFHFQAGRADQELDDFHDALGFPKGERGNAPKDQYSNRFTENGKVLQEIKKNRLGLGDTLFFVKLKAHDETKNAPTVSVILAIKAPTGNEHLGYTAGSWDPGVGVAMTKQLTRNIKAHMTLGAVRPMNADRIDNLTTTYSSMNAIEYYVNNNFSLVLQSNFSTSPFAKYDFEAVNGYSWTIGIGGHIRLPNGIQIHAHFTDELGNPWDTDYVFGLNVDFRSLIDPYPLDQPDPSIPQNP